MHLRRKQSERGVELRVKLELVGVKLAGSLEVLDVFGFFNTL